MRELFAFVIGLTMLISGAAAVYFDNQDIEYEDGMCYIMEVPETAATGNSNEVSTVISQEEATDSSNLGEGEAGEDTTSEAGDTGDNIVEVLLIDGPGGYLPGVDSSNSDLSASVPNSGSEDSGFVAYSPEVMDPVQPAQEDIWQGWFIDGPGGYLPDVPGDNNDIGQYVEPDIASTYPELMPVFCGNIDYQGVDDFTIASDKINTATAWSAFYKAIDLSKNGPTLIDTCNLFVS